MQTTFKYTLLDAGCAEFTLAADTYSIKGNVSYLHDSLADLAEAAIGILFTSTVTQQILFMDEPGEHLLILQPVSPDSDKFLLRLLWYDDWTNHGKKRYIMPKVKFEAYISAVDFASQVQASLREIWEENGAEKYVERWIAHDFPYRLYAELNRDLA